MASVPLPVPESARVLVVDDDPEIRHLLVEFLGDDGHEVREAANGIDALAITRSWRPDLIVLDLLMPVMNGWQFADAYDSQPLRHAPILAITAAGPAAIHSAESLPAICAVLPKPLNLAALHDLVDVSLALRPD